MIDLTLDSILIPDITGYTPPFGTKVARTAINKGGLSTQEVNNNIIASFVKMRGVVITTSDSTSDLEYDAKLLIEANAAITLTLGNATYRGCRVSIVNTTSFTHTLICTSVSTNAPIILPNTSFEIIWTGTAWKSLSAPAVGKRVTQFPQEEPPSTTYPCTKWELMSFDGAFFRAEGTNAAAFIEKTGVLKLQTNQNKSHNHGGHTGYTQPSFSGKAVSGWVDMNNNVNSGSPLGGADGVFSVSGESKINLDSGGWGTRSSRLNFSMTPSGTVQNHAHTITADGGTEARPDNYTVRIWKRIA